MICLKCIPSIYTISSHVLDHACIIVSRANIYFSVVMIKSRTTKDIKAYSMLFNKSINVVSIGRFSFEKKPKMNSKIVERESCERET